MAIPINLLGETFGYLKVIAKGVNQGNHTTWITECICGSIKPVQTRHLRHGDTKSCGCKSNEMRSINNPNNNGNTNDYAYKSYQMMMQRCYNENYSHYKYYGGRGITVDPEVSTFEGFKNALGERPLGHTLDRIDSDGRYSSDNMRWVSRAEQVQNRRNVRYFEYEGELYNIADLHRKFGRSTKFYRDRLITKGEKLEDVLSEFLPSLKWGE